MHEEEKVEVSVHERASATERTEAEDADWGVTDVVDTTWTITGEDTTKVISHRVENSCGGRTAKRVHAEESVAESEVCAGSDRVAQKEEKKEVPVDGQSRGQVTIIALAFAAGLLLLVTIKWKTNEFTKRKN